MQHIIYAKIVSRKWALSLIPKVVLQQRSEKLKSLIHRYLDSTPKKCSIIDPENFSSHIQPCGGFEYT